MKQRGATLGHPADTEACLLKASWRINDLSSSRRVLWLTMALAERWISERVQHGNQSRPWGDEDTLYDWHTERG